jgi:hypothetical protein
MLAAQRRAMAAQEQALKLQAMLAGLAGMGGAMALGAVGGGDGV